MTDTYHAKTHKLSLTLLPIFQFTQWYHYEISLISTKLYASMDRAEQFIVQSLVTQTGQVVFDRFSTACTVTKQQGTKIKKETNKESIYLYKEIF